MILAKITGGLGNQLFQYAVGRAVAMHHQVSLKLDITAYESYELHNGYRLDQFNIEAGIASREEISRLKGAKPWPWIILRRAGLGKKKTYYQEKQRTIYDPAVFEENERYLDGYWQNESYFSSIKDTLLRELSPLAPLSSRAYACALQIREVNAVSIHVRRGDYLNHPEIGVLDVNYYKKAVNYINTKVKNPVFFVFSNDLEWCEKHLRFIDEPKYFMSMQSEIDDLMLMSKCQHNVIANSSFSWWAAWLNLCPNKIVIAPKNWMARNPNGYKWAVEGWLEF